MRVLLDTNVVLDLLLDRQPWSSSLAPLIHATSAGEVEVWIAGTTITNVFYVARKLVGLDRARAITAACLENFRIAAVGEAVLRDAISLAGKDFEDDVQIAAARSAGLDGVLTRDPKGFASCPVAVWDPQAFNALLARAQGHHQP